MGFFDVFKINAALKLHQKGDFDGAQKAYEELYQSGCHRAFYLLPYSVLLLRKGGEANYQKVKEILRVAEKAKDLTPEKRQQLQMNYAVAQYALGEMEKAIHLLEASHRKNPCGLTYQALGFLYVELGDLEKAMAFNHEALDYDDEDPVVLDNLAQTYYRLANDKEKALEYFKKANEIKATQIDTLYFLALYDIENGNRAAAREKLETALKGSFSPLNHATRDKINAQLAAI
ncbi:MAG: tetratricopeptide repeat protein [Clostridia bacterium]|nr:tetratricopeptide repeat protein [Clostridia bacterium]